MRTIENNVAVVTGGTFGVGRGIACELARHGARVFVTGRSAQNGAINDQRITSIRCDHRLDAEVAGAFERVGRETSGIDILVNNVWGGYEHMVENGAFTWTKQFWEQPLWRWDAMFGAGVRAHYRASQLAAPAMISNRHGLIASDLLEPFHRRRISAKTSRTTLTMHSPPHQEPRTGLYGHYLGQRLGDCALKVPQGRPGAGVPRSPERLRLRLLQSDCAGYLLLPVSDTMSGRSARLP